MSLDLFNAVPAGAIGCILGENSKTFFKRADLGRYLGIVDIRHTFGHIATKPRSQIAREGGGQTPSLGKTKNPHDAFVDLRFDHKFALIEL